MNSTKKIIAWTAFALYLLCAFVIRAETPASTASPYSGGNSYGVPRFELFLGYSYVRAIPAPADGNRLVWLHGGSTSAAFNINRHLGLVGDFGAYTNSQMRFTGAYTSTIDVDNPNIAVLSYLFGPRLSFRHDRFTPFAQALFGGVHANHVTIKGCTSNCTLLPAQNSFAMTAGGGLDYRVNHHIAIRLIQAEYLMTRFTSYTTGSAAMQNDMHLSAGVVFRFGGRQHVIPQPPVTYSCVVNPAAVYPGTTIAVSGTAIYLEPDKTAVYTWTTDGGTVTGNSSVASIDTSNVVPGTYTLKGHVSESARPSENADCSATYIVKAFEPPTVSCTANPSTVLSGNSSGISAIGISPQNRPLTYSYSSTSGSVSGSGSKATLTTVGVPTGSIAVTCNVVDDKRQTASGTTTVTVTVPIPAPRPTTSALCSVSFERDSRRPVRVDNEAKACLDQIALNLQQNSNATLVLVGNAAGNESGGPTLAAQRATNTKAYLVGERGIDSARIAVYTGTRDEKIVSTTLVPADAIFISTGVTPVH